MRQFTLILAFPAVLLTLAACSKAVKEDTPKPAAASEGACAGKLAVTGLCPDRAKALMAVDKGEHPAAPKGCEWVVNELAMPGDEMLLYLSAKCNGKTMTFDYAGGAHKAVLSYATSAMNPDSIKGQKLVEIYGAEPDANTAILNYARELIKKPTDAAKCRVRPAGVKGWPADALVVDVSEAEAAKARKDEPRSACGELGLDEDSQRFWRAFQGFTWFFDLGQDDAEFDPGSLTLVRKDANGNWAVSK